MPTHADNVAESSTTTGTGTYNLDGAIAGYRSFVAGTSDGSTVHYSATLGTEYEIGEGVITDASPDTLTRVTIFASSNSDSAVNWGAGTKNIALTLTTDGINRLSDAKNIIINGRGNIYQRGSGTTTHATLAVDRWLLAFSGTGISASSDQATTGLLSSHGPEHFYVQSTTVKSSLASTDFIQISQRIEGKNYSALKYGTASAKTSTLTFRAMTQGVTETISISVRNGTVARSYVTTVEVTGTAQDFTVIIPGDVSGTWDTTSGIGATLSFSLAVGSGLTTSTLDTWQAGNFIGHTSQTNGAATASQAISISDVQLVEGDAAGKFEYRSYGEELALCQRYYWEGKALDSGLSLRYSVNSSSMEGPFCNFPVEMRINPTTAIETAPTYTNATSTDLQVNPNGLVHRLAVTVTGTYRAINGVYSASAEL